MPHVFTVVVLYPARLQQEALTYTAFVTASTAYAARKLGAREAWGKQTNSERGKLREWLPLVVFEGKIAPACYGWESPRWWGAPT